MATPMVSEHAPTGKRGMIGPYRVITPIGVGGMAEVLKVEDTRTGQHRALKIHHVPTKDQQILLLYRFEQRAIGRCDHPNVVKIFDYGVHEDRPYLVMEYVPGCSLTEHVDDLGLELGPARDKVVALLAIQLASALDHVHSRSLVHRDLKPENILVTPDGVLKLIDFGIARDLGHDVEMETDDADVVGTYAYCSPEQVSGIPVDHRSDLYSFGVVFYRLLTNHLPFVAEHAVAYILKHVSETPEPPESYYPSIPDTLRSTVMRLLEKKPVDRPRSGREVQLALKGFVERVTQELRLSAIDIEQGLITQVEGLRLFEPAFVGRTSEQALLEGAISLLQTGVGGVTLVEGEVGLGKARLVDVALADARAKGLPVFTARCLPAADQPYQGILELIHAVIGTIKDEDIPALQVKLGPDLPILARAFPPVQRLLPPNAPTVEDADPRIELERIRQSLKSFVSTVLKQPAVMALRDLQWADHATMSLIASVSQDGLNRNGGGIPVLWLGTVSTDELSDEHALRDWLSTPPSHVQVIRIMPLNVEEVETVVKSMLGGNLQLGLLALDLHRETRGNPLFIAEAVRGLVDRGILNPHQHDEDDEITGWTFQGATATITHTVNDTLAARLESISTPSLELLQRIAVLGRPCSYEWLRSATGVPEEPLLDMIDEVIAKRIIVERKGYQRSIYAFYHPKMPFVIIDSLEPARKEQLHRQVGAAWQDAHGDADNASVELLAYHLFEGGNFIRAAPYLLRAAEARLRLGLNEAALSFLDQALLCCDQPGFDDFRMLTTINLRLGTVLQQLGLTERAWEHLRVAYREAKSHNLLDLQGKSLYVLARLTSWKGDYSTACKHYTGAMKIQRTARDHIGLLRSLNGLSGCLWYLGDLPRSRNLFEESVKNARKLADSSLLSAGIAGLGLVAVNEGQYEVAATHFMEASVVSRTSGRDAFYLHCQLNEAQVRALQGDLGTARALAESVVERLERIDEREKLAAGYNLRALIAIEIRDLEQAQGYLLRSGEYLLRYPHFYERAIRQFLVGVLELARGRPVEAQQGITEALTLAETHQYRELMARVIRHLGVAQLQSGSPNEGMKLIKRAINQADVISSAPGSAEARLFYAEGLLVQGDRAQAEQLLTQASERFREMGTRLLLVRSNVLRGRLAFDAGDHARAKTLLGESLEHVRDILSGLTAEERSTFEKRPEMRLLQALWRVLPAGAA